MKPTVYIETSIPSFYYEIRTEPTPILVTPLEMLGGETI